MDKVGWFVASKLKNEVETSEIGTNDLFDVLLRSLFGTGLCYEISK